MTSREELTDQFQTALSNLVEHMWTNLEPGASADDDLNLEVAEVFASMGQTYVSSWVMVLGVSSIENADAESLVLHYKPRGQSRFVTRGLIEEYLDDNRGGWADG